MCARPANPELRAEILKAATDIVEGCGPDCVTMRQVAEEIGYTPTTLYLYFKDKDAILREVMVEGIESQAAFLASATVGPTPLDKVRQRFRAYVVWGLLHPGLYRLVFESGTDMDFTPEQTSRVIAALSDGFAMIAEAVAAGQLVGMDDVQVFANASWAATHGVTSLAISRRIAGNAASMTPVELLDTATAIGDVLIESLLAPHLATR